MQRQNGWLVTFSCGFAFLIADVANADSERGAMRIRGGQVLVRQSRHICSANNLAFGQSLISELGSTARILVPILVRPAADGGAPEPPPPPAAPAADAEVKLSPEVVAAQTSLNRADAKYQQAIQEIDLALAKPGITLEKTQKLTALRVRVNGLLGGASAVPNGAVQAPAVPAKAPVEPAKAPVEPAKAPVEPAKAPVEPAKAPVEPAKAPVEPEKALVEPEKAPVEPEKAPVEPEKAPVEPEKKAI